MSDIVTVNKLELASELAHRMLVIEWDDRSESIYEDDTADVTVYTENAQDIFNDYYNIFLTIIEDTSYERLKYFD
jgi:hypothetical protein